MSSLFGTPSTDFRKKNGFTIADIDNAPVIWTPDMRPQENRRLMEYFKGRSFWWLKPDENPDQAVRYDPSQPN
jgi:hypothetical protein